MKSNEPFCFHVAVDDDIVAGELGGSDANKSKRLASILNDYEDSQWRRARFDEFVWDNIAETALSKRERESLHQSPASLLRKAATNLRLTASSDDPGQGSELAEVVLYGILKHKYGALPVVPKIFYKQNSQDNAKGADSVHIRREGKDDFTLWFGETKFYSDITDVRLAKVIESVEASLDSGKLRKENSAITSVSDIDHLGLPKPLRDKIRKALSNTVSIDTLKSRIRVPILLLHQCPITAGATDFTAEYLKSVVDFHRARATSYFQKQDHKLSKSVHKYGDIGFHLILFPVPEKAPIVTSFIDAVSFHKR